jgi:anti-sigma factor RsiW
MEESVSEGPRHLTGETFQAYLEGELEAARKGEVETHLADCRRCAAELEGWTLLFRELNELPALGPSPAFRERVLSQVPVRGAQEAPVEARTPGLLERLRTRLAGVGRSASEHLAPERIQELVEGALSGSRARRAAAHLAACGSCQAEAESWQALFRTLDELPVLDPSPEFGARVMAAVDVKAVAERARVARTPLWKRLPAPALAAARRLVPSTRKGWALAGGALAAPAVALVVAVGAVVAHPLLTVGDLVAFTLWRLGDLMGAAGTWALGQVVANPLLAQAWGFVEVLAASPGVAVGGLLAVWTAMLAATWVLYRNVVQPYFAMEHHVH